MRKRPNSQKGKQLQAKLAGKENEWKNMSDDGFILPDVRKVTIIEKKNLKKRLVS